MMINTHMTMANNIMTILKNDKHELIDSKWFIWGCVKPDCASKYKLTKHYYNESYKMILDKIKVLSSLSVYQIENKYGRKKFSEEMGVVCHFLCDYFCLPHYERWEFKNSMKIHMAYEKALGRRAKKYIPKVTRETSIGINDVHTYINENLDIYKKEKGFRNDLRFSYKVSSVILGLIIEEINSNEYVKSKKAV